ncbi:MAG: NIPSNAP family protein [Bryobacteraceae bacterium]|nr:NIPSNAP family protein [Bryobacteraceae bacterium]
MKRRSVLAAAPLAMAQTPAPKRPESSYIELRYFRLRNTRENQRQRVVDFIKNSYLPVAVRAGLGPVGVFSSLIGADTPYILTARSYGSLYAMEQAWDKIGADAEYQKATQAFQALPGLSYMRVETQLLRAFEGFPKVVAPPVDEKKPARVFELRTYEANNWGALRKKIGMFDTMGEIRIFKKTGLLPVFFGETVFGPNQPSLTYLLAFDDLASRERNWRTFVTDPEWLKLRATDGYSDAEIVSNISNTMFSPLPFSQIR